MASMPALDADGFPVFPALPGGRPVAITARSLARVVVGIRGTAVLTAQAGPLAAMVVFLDREPIDGLAVIGDQRLTGPDVLDEIADVPVENVTVTEVDPRLAIVLGSYFLPTAVRGVPARVVVAEEFVRSLAPPGQRGCVLVRAGEALGLVFMARGRVVLAYRQDSDGVGGFELVAPLFSEPDATVCARLGPEEDSAPAPRPVQAAAPAPAGPFEPIWELPPEAAATPPTLPAEPVAEPAVAPGVVLGWTGASQLPPASPSAPPVPPQPAPTAPPPAPMAPAQPTPPVPGAAPAPGPAFESPGLVEAVLEEVRQVLGPNSVRVEGVFLRAEPTPGGLRAAAESLRERRVRLISRATMELVAERALAALDRAGV